MGASSVAERRSVEQNAKAGKTLDRSLGYHLRQLSESWTGALHRKVDAHGVSEGQWRYLRELWEQDGLTQRDLSERVGRQGPTTVAALRSLDRGGYISVQQNEADRRKTRVCLTALGRRTWEALAPLIGEVERAALAGLTPAELKVFTKLIVKMQGNLDRLNRGRNSWALSRTDKLAQSIGG